MFVENIPADIATEDGVMSMRGIVVAECPDCFGRRVWNGSLFDCGCGADMLATVDVYTEWNERAFMAENGVLCVAQYDY